MKKITPKKTLSTNVMVLGVVSLLNDVASEMVYPIVPIFLMTVLGAPALVVGIIEGIADSSSKILMAFTGIVSDRLQEKSSSLGDIASPPCLI